MLRLRPGHDRENVTHPSKSGHERACDWKRTRHPGRARARPGIQVDLRLRGRENLGSRPAPGRRPVERERGPGSKLICGDVDATTLGPGLRRHDEWYAR